MNLLMISGDRLLSRGRKGAFWYTLTNFAKHFERIDVICPYVECPQDSPFENVHIHAAPHGLWYQPFWILKKGRELIEKYDHAVMTVHEYPPFYNGLGARVLHKYTGTPYVIEIHHIVGFPKAANLQEWIGRVMSWLFLRFDVRHAAKVRVVNEDTKKQLSEWGVPTGNIEVVSSFYANHNKLSKDYCTEKKYDVACGGRLVENKGIQEVLEAVALLPQVSLLVIGDGPLRPSLQEKATALGIDCTFTGWLPEDTDVYAALQSAKMFVMNSKSEGGPRIALEAMALGVPVIATKVGVMPIYIKDGENGIFTTGEPQDLVLNMQSLLDDDDFRAKLARRIRVIDSSDFPKDDEECIQGYVTLLKSLS